MKRRKLNYWERHDRDIRLINFGFALAIGLWILFASLSLGALVWQIFWPDSYQAFAEWWFRS